MKTYETEEIAKILNISTASVRKFAYRNDYFCINKNVKTGVKAVWGEDMFKAISEYVSKKRKIKAKRELMKKKAPSLTIEQLKELHPLVTDERCFRLTWFPETVPKGFEDVEKLKIE